MTSLNSSCRNKIETEIIWGAPLEIAEAPSEPNQTSKKKVSVKTAIRLKLLTVFASSSISDGWVGLGWVLDTLPYVFKYKTFCQAIPFR